jgi:O-antigen biosynthesis protein
MQVLVSVLIPTAGRSESFRRCLESVLRSDHSAFEVIVLDQCGDIAQARPSHDPRVRYVRLSTRGKSRALNVGLELARGEFLALTDDDVEVSSDWLRQGTSELLNDRRTAIVFGLLQACPHEPSEAFVPVFVPSQSKTLSTRRQMLLPRVGMGGNMFARKAAVVAAGGWDACIGPGGRFRSGDDWDIAYRIVGPGSRVKIAPNVRGTHWGVRHFADGSVATVINNNFYGVGAGLAKYVRCHDRAACGTVVRTVGGCLAGIVSQSVAARRPRGGRRCLALLAGFRAGLSMPIAPQSDRFADPLGTSLSWVEHIVDDAASVVQGGRAAEATSP